MTSRKRYSPSPRASRCQACPAPRSTSWTADTRVRHRLGQLFGQGIADRPSGTPPRDRQTAARRSSPLNSALHRAPETPDRRATAPGPPTALPPVSEPARLPSLEDLPGSTYAPAARVTRSSDCAPTTSDVPTFTSACSNSPARSSAIDGSRRHSETGLHGRRCGRQSRSRSTGAVRPPPASPVLTTPAPSKRATAAPAGACGQWKIPRGIT